VSKKARSKLIIIIVLTLLIVSVFFVIRCLFFPYPNYEDLDFTERVRNEVISANILLVIASEESGATNYSAGHSGVIYQRDGEKYYALTALHGISFDLDESRPRIIILGYDQPTYNEYVRTGESMGLSSYYSRFPDAVLEYYDVAYDLAVISFFSENEYAVLSIASQLPEYNEPVAAIGNPHEYSRNIITTGRIVSRNPVPFRITDGRIQYDVIEHTAEISDGSSGSALLNEDLEIIGINLGSTGNIFSGFLKGAAMPCDRILEFLSNIDSFKN